MIVLKNIVLSKFKFMLENIFAPMAYQNVVEDLLYSKQAQQHLYLTFVCLIAFMGWKIVYERIRKNMAQMKVIIVGAGPIGLSSALIATKSRKVSEIIIFEELRRNSIINRSYQVTFDPFSIKFLSSIGIDFDNIEGCWNEGSFYTKVGVYLEYILDRLNSTKAKGLCKVFYNKKFDAEMCKSLDSRSGRVLVVVCDGKKGQSARILGLDDFMEERTCSAFGAMAAIERPDQREVPTQEKRVHNLNFDLSAYGSYTQDSNGCPGFSLKIFGNSKNRYISLAIEKCDSPVIKALRTILDRSMMRNIFLKCFNTYKLKSESSVSDSYALNHMKFSPRLFEIKFSQRCETVAYFDDCDMFVVVEGEAAVSCNFHTGMDINQGIRGLTSLEQFINMITWATSEHTISTALIYKMQHCSSVFKELVKSGIKEFMFT